MTQHMRSEFSHRCVLLVVLLQNNFTITKFLIKKTLNNLHKYLINDFYRILPFQYISLFLSKFLQAKTKEVLYTVFNAKHYYYGTTAIRMAFRN